ncbi:acyl-CoA dehydrogenase family protein [Streptosporangium sandarakinum]
MDATPNDAQRVLSRLIRDVVTDVTAADPHDVWKKLTAAGFIEFGLPLGADGLGFGPAEFCLIFEELGAELCDARFVRSALLVLGLWRNTAQEEMLSEALEHVRAQTLSIDAGTHLPEIGSSPAHGQQRPGEMLLRGVSDAQGSWTWVLSRSSSEVSEPRFETSRTADEVRRAFDRDRLMVAAYLVGVARRALELARTRAASRLLGGRPLLERQAVAHEVARAAVTVETARLETWEAACREDVSHLNFTALASALDAAVANAHVAVQLHGAAGTSHVQVTDVYSIAYRAAATWGPSSSLWRSAAARRYAGEGAGP